MYFDQTDFGIPRFLFTGHEERHERDLADLSPGELAFHVLTADRSWAELQKTAEAVSDDISALRKQGIDVGVVFPDVARNKVQVGVDEPRDSDEAALRSQYGPGLYVEDVDTPTLDTCTGRGNCPDPSFKGGLEIFSATDANFCTSGFWGEIGSTKYILTAGHCVDEDFDESIDHASWQHPDGTGIGVAEGGTYHDFPVGGTSRALVDVGWINANNSHDQDPYNRIYSTKTTTYSTEFKATNSEQSVGDGPVCRSDLKSPHWQCGLITATYASTMPDHTYHDVDGHLVGHMNKVAFDADCGDSGAPFLIQRGTAEPGVYVWGAAGMHSDSSRNGPPNECGDSTCSSCYSYDNTVAYMESWASEQGDDLRICYGISCQ